MPRRRPRASTLALAIAFLLASASAAAAPPPPVAPPGASPPPASSPAADAALVDKKAQARDHFERGRALARDRAWAAALAAFLQSKQIYPTWSATSWAATCLEQLQRFDEAIDMRQALLREFADTLPEDVKKAAERRVLELGERFGELIIEEAEPGAVVLIDDHSRERGDRRRERGPRDLGGPPPRRRAHDRGRLRGGSSRRRAR